MAATSPSLVRQPAVDLSLAQVRSMCVLKQRAFALPADAIEERIHGFLASRMSPPREMFIVWDGPTAIATATIFAREIGTTRGPVRVMALAGVCSDPERRGEGWGRLVVRAAFAEVDRGVFPVSLFQTGVPEFYAKLGGRAVNNRFINSRFVSEPNPRRAGESADQPWWNPHVMIYPATFPWPGGVIDLLGPGY